MLSKARLYPPVKPKFDSRRTRSTPGWFSSTYSQELSFEPLSATTIKAPGIRDLFSRSGRNLSRKCFPFQFSITIARDISEVESHSDFKLVLERLCGSDTFRLFASEEVCQRRIEVQPQIVAQLKFCSNTCSH